MYEITAFDDLSILGTPRKPGAYRLVQDGHTRACVQRAFEQLYPSLDPYRLPRGTVGGLRCVCAVPVPWEIVQR